MGLNTSGYPRVQGRGLVPMKSLWLCRILHALPAAHEVCHYSVVLLGFTHIHTHYSSQGCVHTIYTGCNAAPYAAMVCTGMMICDHN